MSADPANPGNPIRAFLAALNDFVVFAQHVHPDTHEARELRQGRINALMAARRPALVAGNQAGELRQDMDVLLSGCVSHCLHWLRWLGTAEALETDEQVRQHRNTRGCILRNELLPALERLEDLAALADGVHTALPRYQRTRGPAPETAEKQRRAADLRGQGLSYKDVGKAIGETASNARTLARRGKEQDA
jgi:hypothetical protein